MMINVQVELSEQHLEHKKAQGETERTQDRHSEPDPVFKSRGKLSWLLPSEPEEPSPEERQRDCQC